MESYTRAINFSVYRVQMTTTPSSDVSPTDDLESRELRLAVAGLQQAQQALEALASKAPGHRAVYTTWARHLADDWRGVALLAARAEV
jgi:hypothetical protein